MTTNERLILIRYYAKILVDHNLPWQELHDIIDRIAELDKQIRESRTEP